MSYQAINEVTRGLRRLLVSQLTAVSPTAVVTLLPPGNALPDRLGVNLYLYRVMESPFTRNRPWPGDRAPTFPSEQPALGLQLSYLLTPLGTTPTTDANTGDDAHTMLGLAMRTLLEHPILNDIHLPNFEADTVLPDFLLNSFEKIKMMLVPTNIEELSKIWATINQPYRLSVAYEVSLVEITPTPPPPVGGGIVLSTGVNVITLDPPRLVALSPVTGALARIAGTTLTANTLRIDGFGFSFPGQTPIVRVAGEQVEINTVPGMTQTSLLPMAAKVARLSYEALVEAILADRPHPEQGYRSCLGILRLAKRYGAARVEAACARAGTVAARLLSPRRFDPQARA